MTLGRVCYPKGNDHSDVNAENVTERGRGLNRIAQGFSRFR